MAELLYRIGRIAARRRLAVVATWVAILFLVVSAFAAFGKTPSSDITIPGTPTAVVTEHLAISMPSTAGATGSVVFSTRDGSPFTAAQKAAISNAVARAAKVTGVTRVVDPFATQAQVEAQAKQISDGRVKIAAAKAQLADGQTQLDAAKAQQAAGQKQLDDAKAQLATQQQQLDAAKAAPGVTAATLAQLNAQQQQLDTGAATIVSKQKETDSGLATIAAQSAQIESGATLLDLASKIRLVSADGSTALATVMFSGTSLSVPQEIKTAVKEAFLTPPIEGVDINFSSAIAQGIPNLVGAGELAHWPTLTGFGPHGRPWRSPAKRAGSL